MRRKIVWESCHIEESTENEEEGYDDEPEAMDMHNAILTPMGLFRVDDTLGNPYKQFEIRMGHTNFPITEEIEKKLDNTPGVDLLKIISPYRFLCAPGKLFKWSEVANLIQSRICSSKYHSIIETLPEDVAATVKKHIADNLSNEDFWRLYVFPNSQIHHKTYTGLSDFSDGGREFQKLQEASNGIILTSE